jgi:hypothetical protein
MEVQLSLRKEAFGVGRNFPSAAHRRTRFPVKLTSRDAEELSAEKDQLRVVLSIFKPHKACYHCLFLYDDADDTIGGQTG